MTIDEIYMTEALKEAAVAAEAKEEPVGAVVVVNRRVVGRAHHQTKGLKDPTAHAAMIALTQLSGTDCAGRSKGASLYVTESLCSMCLAAAEFAGVKRVIFGVRRKTVRTRKVPLKGQVLAQECSALRRKSMRS